MANNANYSVLAGDAVEPEYDEPHMMELKQSEAVPEIGCTLKHRTGPTILEQTFKQA
jgi:hypothetical protein